MKAFFKTLFGDWLNLGFVAAVVAVEVALVRSGYVLQASVVVPLFIMGGVGLLATR
jgi:hypothetical protein